MITERDTEKKRKIRKEEVKKNKEERERGKKAFV